MSAKRTHGTRHLDTHRYLALYGYNNGNVIVGVAVLKVSGLPLQGQELTNNGIPIIVHKCLQFVESHGKMYDLYL